MNMCYFAIRTNIKRCFKKCFHDIQKPPLSVLVPESLALSVVASSRPEGQLRTQNSNPTTDTTSQWDPVPQFLHAHRGQRIVGNQSHAQPGTVKPVPARPAPLFWGKSLKISPAFFYV